MKKRILCIADKVGRIQYNRMKMFENVINDFDIDVITIRRSFDESKYDLIYYTSYKHFDRMPCKKKCIASITSHKGLRPKSIKKSFKLLKKFYGISVNNLHLYKGYIDAFPNIYYTPNGVNTDVYSFREKPKNVVTTFGWVGNKDRSEKNYKKILLPLKEKFKNNPNVKFKIVAPSKSDKVAKLLTREQMIEYYRSIDFLLVTSTTEGTPNPALEAMSCGVPVISTMVGNVTEIINETNGFLINTDVPSFKHTIKLASRMTDNDYNIMSVNIAQSIRDGWSWAEQIKSWKKFFRDFL
jgi:glycosyltransferase involved in cell wall biosynthesis